MSIKQNIIHYTKLLFIFSNLVNPLILHLLKTIKIGSAKKNGGSNVSACNTQWDDFESSEIDYHALQSYRTYLDSFVSIENWDHLQSFQRLSKSKETVDLTIFHAHNEIFWVLYIKYTQYRTLKTSMIRILFLSCYRHEVKFPF